MSSFLNNVVLNVMFLASSLQCVGGLQVPPEQTHRDAPCQNEVNGKWKQRAGYGAMVKKAYAKRKARDTHDLCTLRLCTSGKNYDCPKDTLDWRFESDSLPLFDPDKFLKRMAGKTMSFLGDSLTWQQFNELTCLLHAETNILVEAVERPCGNLTLNELASKKACGQFGFTRVKFTNGATFQFHNANVDVKSINKLGPSTMQLCSNADKIDHRIYEADFMVYNEGAWQKSWEELKTVMDGKLQDIHSRFRGKLFFRDYSATHFANGDFRSEEPGFLDEDIRANESWPKCTDSVQPNGFDTFRSSVARDYMVNAGAHPLCTHSVTLSAPASLHLGGYGDCRHWCSPSPVVGVWNRMMAEVI